MNRILERVELLLEKTLESTKNITAKLIDALSWLSAKLELVEETKGKIVEAIAEKVKEKSEVATDS